jgi:hypothetical protein
MITSNDGYNGANEMTIQFTAASQPLRTLINFTIKSAIDFCMDMRQDEMPEEVENMTLKSIRNQVIYQASDFFAQELGTDEAPELIVDYIIARVNEMPIAVVLGAVQE